MLSETRGMKARKIAEGEESKKDELARKNVVHVPMGRSRAREFSDYKAAFWLGDRGSVLFETAVTRAIRAETIEANVLRRGSRKECECLRFRRDRTPDNSESRSLETFAILVVYDFGSDTAHRNQDFALIDQKFLLPHQGRVLRQRNHAPR